MKTNHLILFNVILTFANWGFSQTDPIAPSPEMAKKIGLNGVHFGFVQPLWIHKKDTSFWLTDKENYIIGFPMGLNLSTAGKLLLDFEMVPFIKPFLDKNDQLSVHLLLHPGILYPLGNSWTLGLRAAFEIGQNQAGFTLLVNKSFPIMKNTRGFIELVFPQRYGPSSTDGFSNIFAVHVGIGL